jgi:hypothetical protein
MYFVAQPIVTNGLVLNMDAGNTLSYTSGSSTWNDLSGNNFTGSLVNSPVFTPSNGGALTFNGSNNRVTLGDNQTLQFTDNFSAFTWFKKSTSQAQVGIVGNASYNNGGWMIGLGNSYPTERLIIVFNSTSEQGVNGTTTLNPGLWYYGGFTFTGGTLIAYVNGKQDGISTGHSITKNTTSFLIGQGTQGGWNYFNGSVASTQIYNRALTLSEVTQNFNALRGRYGL